MSWYPYILIFFFAQIKFLFTPLAAYIKWPELSFLEIFISTVIGALFCFNVVYFLAKRIMTFFHKRRVARNLDPNKKNKKVFTWKNKWIVKVKRSDKGFYLICLFAPLFLSIPIGTIVVAKFYGQRSISYYLVSVLLVVTSFLLTYSSKFLVSFIDNSFISFF